MIVFFALLMLFCLSLCGAIWFCIAKNKDARDACAAIVVVTGIAQLIFSGITYGMYIQSLELEGLQQKAITAAEAVKKGKTYSQDELTAYGNLGGNLGLGDIKVNQRKPSIRHKLEISAVQIIMRYNEELVTLQAKYRTRLWTPYWGIQSKVMKMKPISIPDMIAGPKK